MPFSEVVSEVDPAKTLMASPTAPVPVLPIIFALTCVGAVALFIYTPMKEDGAGADPTLFISMPLTWLPIISPPVLAQLMPVIKDELAVAEVVVFTTMEELTVFDPIIFPSPGLVPPIFIPEPCVSIPVKVLEFAADGLVDSEIVAISLLLMFDAGDALVVVNKIPW